MRPVSLMNVSLFDLLVELDTAQKEIDSRRRKNPFCYRKDDARIKIEYYYSMNSQGVFHRPKNIAADEWNVR